MIIFKKNQKIQLSKNFDSDEYQCKCDLFSCDQQQLSSTLRDKIQCVRDEYGAPLEITSAYRCSEHQNTLRKSGIKTAVGKSTHELGTAVDIRPYKHTKENMNRLFTILEKYFDSIGIAKSFFHVDERPGKRRWNY